MKNIIFLSLLVFSMSSCEKRFNNPIAEKYEIKGTLFEAYDAPAIPYYPLELIYYEVNSRSQWVNQKTIDRTQTDKDGYFEFKYSKFSDSKKGHLAIIQDESGLKEGQAFVSAPFLKGIPLNESIDRNISGLGLSKLVINFKWNQPLASDTLFVNGGGMMIGFNADFKEQRQSAWGYILEQSQKNVMLEFDFQWDTDISQEQRTILVWGVGYNHFYQGILSRGYDSIPEIDNSKRFLRSGFPITDTLYINLD